MKATEWIKYESDGNDGFPSALSVELCDLGTEVEFDKKYSKFYFFPKGDETVIGENGKELKEPPDLIRSCEWVEDMIFEDCKQSTWRAVDILRILAWKTGRINHPKCENKNNVIQYDANWVEGKSDDRFASLQIPYQRVVEWPIFEPIVSSIQDIRKKYLVLIYT